MKKSLAGLLAIVCAAVSGCAFNAPFRGQDEKEGIYFDGKIRSGIDVIGYDVNLGKKFQTTPVHPDDADFLHGETTTNVGGKVDGAPRIGLEGSWGIKEARFKLVGDIRYNLLSSRTGYRVGIYDTEQQISDPRPAANGSFVFTQFRPNPFTFIPSIGFESTLSDKLVLEFELGLPYTGFDVRSGHDRYGRWQTVQKDSWNGFGLSFGGAIGWHISDDLTFFLNGGYETYNPKFAGEKAKVGAGKGAILLEYEF